MAKILGLGCSHGPIILTPPEAWARGRERIFSRVTNYQPPPQLLEALGQDKGRFPLLPLFVNCYGEDAGPDYPPRPTPRRCYALGRSIRQFLDQRPERVAVVASSSWSHSFLAHKFQCCAIDLEFDRHNLELVRRGEGSKLAELTPEAIQQSGDHELLNWIIALGILGDRPAEIIDVRESHTQLAFRVTALWG